jgi:5-methyltetrahydropteroyltriglutamate--homocysteine methyltransferase
VTTGSSPISSRRTRPGVDGVDRRARHTSGHHDVEPLLPAAGRERLEQQRLQPLASRRTVLVAGEPRVLGQLRHAERGSEHPNPVARVTGPISRPHPIQVEDVKFLRANTDHQIKVTVPGPFTMSQQAQDDFYGDPQALAFAYADAVNAEVVDLFAAGADIVQLDEPYLQARPEPARQYGLSALNRALDGVLGTTAVHLCFGYAAIIHERPSGYSFLPELADCSCDQISIETAQSNLDTAVLAELTGKTIILGGIDLSDPVVETAETVADRVRRALPYVAPDKVIVATDCGMKYLPRQSALGKMQAMSGAAQLLRAEFG